MYAVKNGRGAYTKAQIRIDHLELATAAEYRDENATSTPAVDPPPPYARAPADNPTITEPRSSTPAQPCPSNTKPDVDEGDESSVFGKSHV